MAQISLTDAETDMILTNDPDKFMDGITAQLFYANKNNQEHMFKRHRELFGVWLHHYNTDLTVKLTKLLHGESIKEHASDIEHSYMAGQLAALTSLPLMKSMIHGEVVDLKQVTAAIKELKELA